jgi:hypothetical protein
MTCSRDSLANLLGARLFAMRAAVFCNGPFDFRASGAGPNRSRNRVRGGDVVDAGSHQRHRLPGKTWIREPFHAVHLRRGELVRHRYPWRPLEDVLERPSTFDVHEEVRCRQGQRERRGRLLKLFADSGERFVGHLLGRHSCDNARREARREQRQSHAIKTMMPCVQPDGGPR